MADIVKLSERALEEATALARPVAANGATPPGLEWRTKDGMRSAYWVAPAEFTNLGFKPASERVWSGLNEPSAADHRDIKQDCERLQQKMLDWAKKPIFKDQPLPTVVEILQNGAGEAGTVQSTEPKKTHTEPTTNAFTFLGDAPATPPNELIKKLLPAAGVVVTGGQSSSGKTFIHIHKAICLGAGRPYFGHKIVERVGTAFVAAEGRALIPNRFAAALAKQEINDKLPIAWINQLPDFSSADGVNLFIQRLKGLDERFRGDFGVRLGQVTIDTVAACFSMKDEDDNAEATKVCNIMRAIGDSTGALMAPVHHFGKNPESGLRGASAWKGSADMIEGVLADIDPLSGRASNRELVCAKARDGEQGPISAFELEFVELGLDADGEIYGSCCVVPATKGSRFEKTSAPSKGQRAIQEAITEALDRWGQVITPRAGMVAVKAAKVIDVREEFDRRYVVDETDPVKAANAKRMAFKRALDHLSPSKYGAGSAEGADWIWVVQ
jgi:hypothetical protein